MPEKKYINVTDIVDEAAKAAGAAIEAILYENIETLSRRKGCGVGCRCMPRIIALLALTHAQVCQAKFCAENGMTDEEIREMMDMVAKQHGYDLVREVATHLN